MRRLNFQPVEVLEPVAVQEHPFLVLGGRAPRVPGADFSGTIGAPCAAIILIGQATAAEVLTALDAAPDPAIPIADFVGIAGIRRDFRGKHLDEETIADLRWSFTPLWHRLAEMPFEAPREDRADLTVLRLAYSRDTPIEARFSLEIQSLVEYPLLGPGAAIRQRVELLADLGLLRRRHFARTHACGKCGSARLHAYEACPACDSANLVEEPLVHHYRCGWQEAESHFLGDRMLVCPKCHRELRHYGVDYGKPGIVVTCKACGAANAEPKPLFVCLDCSATTPTTEAADTDWFHYDLAEEGTRALGLGRLPHLDVGTMLEGRTRAFSRREFQILVTEGIRIARRYERPFAVAKISLSDVAALRGSNGSTNVDAAFRLAIDLVVETLRDSDFVAAAGPTSVLLGFPETSASDVNSIVERLRKKIAETVLVPLAVTATAAEGEAATDLLAET